MRKRKFFMIAKPIIVPTYLLLKVFPRFFRNFLFRCFRNIKGNVGVLLRYIVIKSIVKDCGENIVIYEGVFLYNLDMLRLGNNISIHPMSYMQCKGKLEIGNDVSIAHGVTIMTTSHIFDRKDVPIKDQGISLKPIKISNGVWIGAKATILSGITIGESSIVGANSVVTKDVDSYVVVGGSPAVLIKERK